MIKVQAIRQFTLSDYDKIKDTLQRKTINRDGTIFEDDIFECDEEMAKYLMGNNESGVVVVKVLEYIPETKARKK